MPALNFSAKFVPLIESGKKKQTIRKRRKIPIGEGDKIFLYTGMRTKSCRQLGIGRVLEVLNCCITDSGIYIQGLRERNLESFARMDGFSEWEEMKTWFKDRYGLPFDGVVIFWEKEDS